VRIGMFRYYKPVANETEGGKRPFKPVERSEEVYTATRLKAMARDSPKVSASWNHYCDNQAAMALMAGDSIPPRALL
jgi:hypothetical protein